MFLFFYLYLIDIIITIPPAVYWFLIILSLVVAVLSHSQKFIPGQTPSVAILLFIVFVPIFSIDVLLVIIETIIIFINFKRNYSLTS